MKRILALVLAFMLLACSALAAPAVQESPVKKGFKKNVADCPMDGLYIDFVTLEDETVRTLYHYYPTDLSFRYPVLFVAVPDGVDAVEWVDEMGWFAMADEKDFMVIVLVPGEGGWQADELAYTHAVYDYAQGRAYYVNDDSAYYVVGYGKAADVVMAEAMTQADLYAGFACLGGEFAAADAWIASAQITESAEKGRMQSTVPCPMWIGAAEKTDAVAALVDYWVAANDDYAGDVYSNAFADEIYMPAPYLAKDLSLTDNRLCKTLLTLGEDFTAPEFSEYLWSEFLSRARRQDSWDVGAMRYAADIDGELGCDYYELDYEGTKEWFFVYVPEAVKAGAYTNVPVMFVTHGSNGGADENSLRSGMLRVAEQYNFIMVSTQNNSNVKIWKEDLDLVLANYPMIDATRIYVSGQSQGCQFCLKIAEAYPEVIACVAAASYVLQDYRESALAKREIVNEDILVPVFLSVGYKDSYYAPGSSTTKMYPALGTYWMTRNGVEDFDWIDEEQGWNGSLRYDFGEYHNWVGLNNQNIPMFRWQRVDDKIHAYTVEEGIMFYEYAAQFSRGADGTLYYMGMPVVK